MRIFVSFRIIAVRRIYAEDQRTMDARASHPMDHFSSHSARFCLIRIKYRLLDAFSGRVSYDSHKGTNNS